MTSNGAGAPAGRFVYLILSHKAAWQVENLAERILNLSPAGEVVVHHDAASHDLPWNGAPAARRHLVERGRVSWGDWSMVEATQRLLRFGVEELEADWLVIISGQDRPAVDLAAWERTLARSGADAWVRADALPSRLHFGRAEPRPNMLLARVRHRWRPIASPSSRVTDRVLSALMTLSCALHPLIKLEHSNQRGFVLGARRAMGPVSGWSFYKGSQWMALRTQAAQALLEMDNDVADWFAHSWIPDETYLQTLLHRTSGFTVCDKSVSYVPPSQKRSPPDWMDLALEDLPAVWASGAAFARKVDLAEHPEVVAAIDAEVDRNRAASTIWSPRQ
jgi:hypothetical protein